MSTEHDDSTRVERIEVLKRMASQALERLFVWAAIAFVFLLVGVAIYVVGIPARELVVYGGLILPDSSVHTDRFVWGLFFTTFAAFVAVSLHGWYENAKKKVREERELQS